MMRITKENRKLILALLLSAALAASLFACGREDTPPVESDTQAATETESESQSETETLTVTEPTTEAPELFEYSGNTLTGVKDRSATAYEIPDWVTAIDDYAFRDCVNLTSLVIPDGVTEIGGGAFKNCAALTSVVLPSELESIESSLFEGCSALTELTIPDSVTMVDPSAFEGCTALVQKEHGLSYVDRWVIDCDNTVSTLTWRSGTVGLATSAFEGCDSLVSISIPDSIQHIGFYVFDGCTSIEEANIPSSVVFNLPKTSLRRVTITSGTVIDEYAFYNCSKLESVTMPDTIVKIGTYAFSGCSALTELTVPQSVTNIGLNAFTHCSALRKVTLPEGLSSIPAQAFMGCSSLSELTIPASVTNVGMQAFYGCNRLVESVNNVSYVSTWAIGFKGNATELTLREGTVGIADETFKGSRLVTVTLSDTLKYIGHYAFEDCKNLETVVSSPVLEQIGFHSFSQCMMLKTFSLPDTMDTVNADSFFGCTFFLRKTPYHVTYADRWVVGCTNTTEFAVLNADTVGIGPNVFGGCANLKVIYFEGTSEEWDELRIDPAGNGTVSSLPVAFLSETEPVGDGTFWHYVEGFPTLWE